MRLFPNEKIVADRFHVIKLIISTFHKFCKAEDPNIRWSRGAVAGLVSAWEGVALAKPPAMPKRAWVLKIKNAL